MSPIFSAVAFTVGLTAFAAAAAAGGLIPTQQSQCEVRANRFKATHPHAEWYQFPQLNFGLFPFGAAAPPSAPAVYHDSESAISIYVESDGRHLAAISDRGKLLWVRNPFVDDDMCPYRSAHPYIYRVGRPAIGCGLRCNTPASKSEAQVDALIVTELRKEATYARKVPSAPKIGARFIVLSFNSSQFGYVNIDNGDFYFMGQN